jgi:hypothetical protein
MSLKVSIDHGGRQSVVVEKDRGKRSKVGVVARVAVHMC